MRLLRYFFKVTLMVAGVLLLMVISDLVNPPKGIEVTIDPTFVVYPEDDIRNPDNDEFVNEVAFNLDIDRDSVTQEQFNDRYINR